MPGPTCTTTLFTCSNDVIPSLNTDGGSDWTEDDQKRWTAGVCAAMSVRFLYTINDGKNHTHFKSDIDKQEVKKELSHVQAWYEKQDSKTSDLAIIGMHQLESLASLEHVVTYDETGKLDKWLAKLAAQTGSYYICTSDHAMALVVYGDRVHFLDPDEGLFEWNPKDNFAANFDAYIHSAYSDESEVEIHMVYPKSKLAAIRDSGPFTIPSP